MKSYKLCKSQFSSDYETVNRVNDNAYIPFNLENTDCRRFLIDWRDGAEVRGADEMLMAYSDDAVRALGLEPPA